MHDYIELEVVVFKKCDDHKRTNMEMERGTNASTWDNVKQEHDHSSSVLYGWNVDTAFGFEVF